MDLICQLHHIHVGFGEKILFKDADLSLHFGEKVGLIGPNGQGKSTLFKILTGETTPDTSNPPFIFSKASGRPGADRSYGVFHVPQELPFTHPDCAKDPSLDQEMLQIQFYLLHFYPELFALYAKKDLEEFTHQGGWDLLNAYESYLKLFGLTDWERPLYQLSGGEQRKVALAIGLCARTPFVLWDEPTNHLDLQTIEMFEDELINSTQTILLITHDRYLLNRVCSRILHIEQGKVNSFQGTYFDYLKYLEQKDKDRLALLDKMANHMRREDAWMKQGIKARGTRSKKRVETFHNLQDTISELKSEAKKKVSLNMYDSGRQTKVLFSLQEAGFGFSPTSEKTDERLFQNVSVSLKQGDKVALMGPNGSGKTTMLKLVLGEMSPQEGRVQRAQQLVTHYFSQKREVLELERTAFEIIGEGSEFIDLPHGGKQHIHTYLESFLFKRSDIHRPIKTFSGGEKNRLMLAMFLKREADLWIFDEPTNDLDLETLLLLEEKLRDFKGSVLIVSHDRAFLEQVANRAWVLYEKGIEVFEGGPSQAMIFLKAMELEKEDRENLENSENKERARQEEIARIKTQKKLSHKEQKRLDELPKLIESLEQKIAGLEEQMSGFDFQKMNAKNNQGHQEGIGEFQKLETELKKNQQALEACMEEYFALAES